MHISELADPTPWLSGGELLLTTGHEPRRTRPSQRAFVERLAAPRPRGARASASASRTPRCPTALREAAAEALGFPLFEVPYEVPFIAITEKAFSHLVNEQYAVLQRALSAHERLERIVLSEQGLEGVAGALAALIGGTAMVFDARGEALARCDGAAPLRRRRARGDRGRGARARPRRRARAATRRPASCTAARSRCRSCARPAAATATARRRRRGSWRSRTAAGSAEFDRLVLHQAVTVVALELLRRRVADDTERRLAGDVLSAMVSGELAGAELARRLEPFGLRERVGVLVLTPAALGPRRRWRTALERRAARRGARRAGGRHRAASPARCCRSRARRGRRRPVRARRARARARRRKRRGRGARRRRRAAPSAPADLRRAFHEARCALEARALARRGETDGGAAGALLATYRDLGSFQLLLSLQDDDALRLFCDSILAPIEEGEGAYGGELMRSLEAFIECNGQWERAARQLYCHRHTLRYRIRRVEELTGPLAGLRARPDRLLARPARPRAGPD